MRRYVIIAFLTFSSFVQALDFEARFYGGLGAASGSFVEKVELRYASLGASSLSEPGSSRPGLAALLGGGLGLAWNGGASLSFAAGADYGSWGLVLVGERAGGTDFASLGLSAAALSLGAELRWLPNPGLEISFGPIIGLTVSDYRVTERISGTESRALVEPLALERAFLAGGLGLAYLAGFGGRPLALGLRAELGLTPLAMEKGALGEELTLPWRALLFARYALGRSEARR